jgi:hypothetical protein
MGQKEYTCFVAENDFNTSSDGDKLISSIFSYLEPELSCPRPLAFVP